MSGNSYLETLIAASIFVPLTIVIVLAWFFLRVPRTTPTRKRLRKAQENAAQADRR